MGTFARAHSFNILFPISVIMLYKMCYLVIFYCFQQNQTEFVMMILGVSKWCAIDEREAS